MAFSQLPLACYLIISAALSIFGAHMGLLLLLGRRSLWRRDRLRALRSPPGPRPRVTVQLPLYNERLVAERGIKALAALTWPCDRLEIQVLDDSTDETREIARRTVAELKAAGHAIVLLPRSHRTGFKAGALAAALPLATGEFIAMFDADFLPQPDFLEKLLVDRAPFADPAVGFVQARWSYCNREANWLTRAQATMHDPHFFIEQPVRSAYGWPFNFNGSGGIWRRACIEDSGGWQADTLTEDLDLSYRARLRGWFGLYAGDVLVPSELPEDIFSLKRQQARWARGSIQCARRLLAGVWSSAHISRVGKAAATVHLLGYTLHVCMVGYLLAGGLCQILPLWYPGVPALPDWLLWLLPLGLCYPAAIVYAQCVQRGFSAALVMEFLVAAWLGIGLGFSNSVAVCKGAFGRATGTFLRTPKSGGSSSIPQGPYRIRPDWTILGEAFMAVALLGFAVELARLSRPAWALVPLYYAGGYLLILGLQLREIFQAGRSPGWAGSALALRPFPQGEK